MINKWKFTITAFSLATVLTGFMLIPGSNPPNNYDFVVMKIGNDWKVAEAANHANHKIHAKRKDTIVWTIVGTDASFQFPAALFDPASPDDSLASGYKKTVKNGKKLKLRVKDSAAAGTYDYAVFCTAGGVFATGDSPPKIIIEN